MFIPFTYLYLLLTSFHLIYELHYFFCAVRISPNVEVLDDCHQCLFDIFIAWSSVRWHQRANHLLLYHLLVLLLLHPIKLLLLALVRGWHELRTKSIRLLVWCKGNWWHAVHHLHVLWVWMLSVIMLLSNHLLMMLMLPRHHVGVMRTMIQGYRHLELLEICLTLLRDRHRLLRGVCLWDLRVWGGGWAEQKSALWGLWYWVLLREFILERGKYCTFNLWHLGEI